MAHTFVVICVEHIYSISARSLSFSTPSPSFCVLSPILPLLVSYILFSEIYKEYKFSLSQAIQDVDGFVSSLEQI